MLLPYPCTGKVLPIYNSVAKFVKISESAKKLSEIVSLLDINLYCFSIDSFVLMYLLME